ncbi:MAG: NAD(P)H-hydrate dehydratase [candidate division Zixibacteria bacterium]|nr:NAD(P)H-hydrate dehydratase [candidate division Zixibacteria bacterium]
MKLVTSEQMRNIDREAIDIKKIPSLELMENAGRGIAQAIIQSLFYNINNRKVIIFCGKGNNGGDGFVVGRYLFQAGCEVTIYYPSPENKLSVDASENCNKAKKLNINMHEIDSIDSLPNNLAADFIIDAVFGNGFAGAPRGLLGDMIEYINSQNITTIAIDMPSGLNADNGQYEGCVVQADYTFTLALPKLGMYVSPGRELSGEIQIIPIGIPDDVIENFNLKTDLLTTQKISSLLPSRKPDGHKGDFGKILCIAGSSGLTGAAILTAKTALRSGCGLVKVACPHSILPTIASSVTEATLAPMPDVKKNGHLALRGLGQLLELANEHDSIIIGPGLGQHYETKELVKRFVARCDKPMIIDADGLNALVKFTKILKEKRTRCVLTPHPGEFFRLTGNKVADDIQKRIAQASSFAKEYGVVLVLKGSPTLIADTDGKVALNPTGNNGMATGGSGDVLSGIIGTLLGQSVSAFDSACGAVYIHGLSGDFGTEEIGARSLISGDLVDYLPEAFQFLEL